MNQLIIVSLFGYFAIGNLFLSSIWPSESIQQSIQLSQKEQLFFVITLYVVHLITYTIVNLFYLYCYGCQSKYKSPWPWEKPQQWEQMKKLYWKNVFLNQFIMIGVAYLASSIKMDCRFDDSFPSLFEISWQILAFAVIEDALFYFSHRMLHTGFLYRNIHKVHHSYNITVSWSAEFAHPIEYIVGNLIPVISGPLLLGERVHMITILIFVGLATHKTLADHSGFSFPWDVYQYLPLTTHSTFHSKHHSLNTGNYSSTFKYLDYLLGTTIKNK